jgi:predicted HTH domain antitoxin
MNLVIDYPESLPDAMQISPAEFEREARFAMASRLYQEGRISSGHAALLAGMARVDFLFTLSRHGISISNLSDEDLLDDLAHVP